MLLTAELGWLIAGMVWLVKFYADSPAQTGKQATLGTYYTYFYQNKP